MATFPGGIFDPANPSPTTSRASGAEGPAEEVDALNNEVVAIETFLEASGGGDPSSVNTHTITSGTYTLPAIATDQIHVLTLQSSVTLTFPTAAAGDSFQIQAIQDGTGSRVITWPGTVVWADGLAAAPSTAASATDYYAFTCYDGTHWIANWEPGYVSSLAVPIPELVYTNATASGSVTLQNPTTTGYTIQRYEVPNSDTLTLVNFPATAGSSCEVQIETGTGTSVVFPTTNTRWAGTISGAGSAPTVPASSVTRFAVECVDGTHLDWSFVGRYA